MNSIIKKMIPITLLLLSGCAHHNGFHLGRPYHHGSYDISLGSYFYKDHHRFKPRGYSHKWRPFYSRRHHYQRDHKYHDRRYKDGYNYFKYKKYSPKHHKHDDRC